MAMPRNDFEMMIPRMTMSSIVLNESKIWITGGISIFGKNGNNNPGNNSTEIISLDQPPV